MTEGWTRRPDGIVLVRHTTDFPDATPEMFDWWFWWHQVDSARYCRWYPESHISVRARYPERLTQPGLTHRERYVGNDSFVTEHIGARLTRVRIRFRPPSEFGIRADQTAICALVSLNWLPINFARIVHHVEESETGCTLHSNFELGAGLPRILRRLTLPKTIGADLYAHCRAEYAHLATFLPRQFRSEEEGAVNERR